MGDRKTIVLDTSVLLYDMTSIHSFPGNDVVIPLIVLDELDRFKDKPSLLGESARYVNRYLDTLRKIGRLDRAVVIPDHDQTIRIETDDSDIKKSTPDGLDPTQGDNKIVTTAILLGLRDTSKTIKVVTKDINLRVKCDALGIIAEDYYKDRVPVEKSGLYEGVTDICVPDRIIDDLYRTGTLDIEEVSNDVDLLPNQFVIIKGTENSSKSCLAAYKNEEIRVVKKISLTNMSDICPKNKEQTFAMSLLSDPNIPLVTLTGIAGSGKTFLSLAAGLSGIL